MVVGLLSVLTLMVCQLALAVHIRNTLLDAAAEGARFAALGDNEPADGVARTRALASAALGTQYPIEVNAATTTRLGHPAVAVTVQARLPLVGLVGVEDGLEVRAHAVMEGTGSG